MNALVLGILRGSTKNQVRHPVVILISVQVTDVKPFNPIPGIYLIDQVVKKPRFPLETEEPVTVFPLPRLHHLRYGSKGSVSGGQNPGANLALTTHVVEAFKSGDRFPILIVQRFPQDAESPVRRTREPSEDPESGHPTSDQPAICTWWHCPG